MSSAGDLNRAQLIHDVSEYFVIDSAQLGDSPGRIISGFLDRMTSVAFGPFPLDLVPVARFVQPRPPLMIRLATKAPAHRFDHVTRIRVQVHIARFTQGFEADGRGRDLRLLIRSGAEISPDCPPQASISKQSSGSGARTATTIIKAGAVAEDCY